MKLIKKVFLILFVTLFIFLGFSISGKADDSKSDNEQATWTSENETIKKIGDLTHSLAYGKTTYPGLSDGNQKVNAFSMKTDGVNSKLVTWAIQRNNNMYSRSTLTSIAKNYEETHPGWIVLAGVNGDQYYATYGSGFVTNGSFFYYNQPYYPMIVDGERRFAITPTGVSASNYVGVKNDGSSSSLLAASALKGLRVEILDENNEITSWYDVDAINETPAEGKTAVWISYNSATSESEKITFDVTSTGNIYLVEDPEFSYMSNNHNYPIGSKTDALFSRGVISKVAKQVKVDANQFAIETLNEELKSVLKENVKIRVQFYYENDLMNQVESTLGYHSVQRYDNKDVEANQGYDSRRYNRCIFGRKADGTYVLLTVAKAEYAGTNQDESNAILKYYGVTEAYQQDGGGSVTAIIRDNYGGFTITSSSSDSPSSTAQRSIYEGCFFVVRDPEYRCYGMDSTPSSLTIKRVSSLNKDIISNIKATVNGKTYDCSSDEIVVKGLEEGTTYDIHLTYDVTVNGKTIPCSFDLEGTTDTYQAPGSGIETVIGSNQITFIHTDKYVKKYEELKFTINGQTYDLTQNDSRVTVEGLTPNTDYEVIVEYKLYDEESEKIREVTEKFNITTKAFNTPEIKTFEVVRTGKSSVQINVEIIDKDNLVVEYYVMYSGKKVDLKSLNCKEILSDLDIVNKEYNFQLFLKYKYKDNEQLIQSDVVTINNTNEYVENGNNKGCKCRKDLYIFDILSSISLLVILLKKKR